MQIDGKNVNIGDKMLITEQCRGIPMGMPNTISVEGLLQEVSADQKSIKINNTWYAVSDIKVFDLLVE
jgi:hypothetical protein